MRVYNKEQACGFRYTRAAWGTFSNFQPLAVPIVTGPWSFGTSEAVYQACKFPATPASSGASPKSRRRGKRRPSAAPPASASTPAGTRNA